MSKLQKKSLAEVNPTLASEWHPTKNGDLTPQDVTAGSHSEVWWCCSLGHEWQARIVDRISGSGCPVCSGRKILVGFNDLASTHPQLAAEWHPTKNEELTPQDVTQGSHKKIWWLCPHGHEWQTFIYNRVKGQGCPICAGKIILVGFNDLATTHPELAAEWHPTKNGDLSPQNVTAGSNKKIWWRCSLGHEWETKVFYRSQGQGCPICAGHKVLVGFNDLATTQPQLAKEWHPIKNGDLTPQDVTQGSRKKVWWRCSLGHEWQATINSRSQGRGCLICSRLNKKKKKWYHVDNGVTW